MDPTASAGAAPTEDSALVPQASSEHGEHSEHLEPQRVRRLPLAAALLATLACAAGISYRLQHGSALTRQPLLSPAFPILEQAESKPRHALVIGPSPAKAKGTDSDATHRERSCLTFPGIVLADGAGFIGSVEGKKKMPSAAKCQEECIKRANCAQAVYARAADGCYMSGGRTLEVGVPGIDSDDSDDYHESMLCGTSDEMSKLKPEHARVLDIATMQNEALEGWKKMSKLKQDRLAEVASKWDDAEKRAREALESMAPWGKAALLKGIPKTGSGYAGFIQNGDVRLTMNDGPQGYNAYTTDKASKSTQFPALLSIAASFNPEISRRYAQAVAEEFTVKGSNVLLGPDVEIIRSPLSGRSFETLTGEDPYLGSELVRPFVRAVQAKGIIATVKHWLNNNEEIYRQSMNVEVGDREQHEIYMPVFKAAFEAGAGSVMCAYNRVYGEHACENKKLLHDLLREDLGFRGFVVSDWGATHDGVKSAFAGLDVEMPEGDAFNGLSPDEHGDRIDRMAGHVLSSWFASGQADGLFGADEGVYPGSPASDARTDAHLNVARETIIDSAVLLKNKDGVLPLQGAGKKIVLVGRYCNQGTDSDFLQGSVYSGGGSGYVESSTLVTPYNGIRQKFPDAASVTLAQTADDVDSADVAIVCVSAHAEEGWDRTGLDIPDAYALVHGLREKDPSMTIVVLAISPGVVTTGWVWDADAALMLFMPGEQKRYTKDQYPGTCPPPNTWCKEMTANFSEGVLIGYRWNDAMGVPSVFPFGYGLTYTEFEFTNQDVICSKERAVVTMTVKNIGWRKGAAVPQLYVSFPSLSPVVRQLRGFQKVDVEKDSEVNVAFFLGPEDWSYFDVDAQAWVSAVSKGENITVSLGSSSTDLPWNRTFSC
ncbi:unnamed protein product [Prorocentrum cordatum]|uniref:Probable beta-glucosidase G n=1 Tax=Prorocentrum cordatum TaxID=2364126 RepID=A0ABN9UH87_9DINO|nr:unnamed protein product [Polarella glacialis]